MIIPCYNEADGLEALVNSCSHPDIAKLAEIILVDNGSDDETPERLKELLVNKKHIRSVRLEQNRGYGHGILFGLSHARNEIVGWTHADLQTDPHDIVQAIPLIASEPEKTFVKGKRYGRNRSDVLFTFGMTMFEFALLRYWMSDINAQPTLFPRKLLDSCSDAPHDFSLDLFVFYTAKKLNYSIKRFPVYFGARAFGTSHWNIDFKSKFKFITRTIKYSFEMKRKLG